MRLIVLVLLASSMACGGRDVALGSRVSTNTSGVDASGVELGGGVLLGALCAWQTGVVTSCDAGEVQRCQPDEGCALHYLPNPGFGESPVYECCTGSAEQTCAGRQFETGYVCQ
jgi:hypothetical protein